MKKPLIFLIFFLLIFSKNFSQPTGGEKKIIRLSLKIKSKGRVSKFSLSTEGSNTVISDNGFKINSFTSNYRNKTLIDSTKIIVNNNAPYGITLHEEEIKISYIGKYDWIDQYYSNLNLIIKKKCQQMQIKLKIYESAKIDVEIPFKKGNFEITDPENPKLIRIKE
ncbi:hypothetical protein [Aquimarina pacifica]|uniref:hypothetical protein n=1 Tax=Aquimarina pacifica TaxID=1296415 RepID=UPI0004729EC6|nr:hypothetical protein [Aquimarina pacifica]